MVISALQNQAFCKVQLFSKLANCLKQAAVQKGRRRRGRKSLDVLRQLRRLLLVRRLENLGGDKNQMVVRVEGGYKQITLQTLEKVSPTQHRDRNCQCRS